MKTRDDVKATAITDEKGDFIISGRIPNGTYTLVVESKSFKGTRDIEVAGHELNGMDIPLQKNDF